MSCERCAISRCRIIYMNWSDYHGQSVMRRILGHLVVMYVIAIYTCFRREPPVLDACSDVSECSGVSPCWTTVCVASFWCVYLSFNPGLPDRISAFISHGSWLQRWCSIGHVHTSHEPLYWLMNAEQYCLKYHHRILAFKLREKRLA